MLPTCRQKRSPAGAGARNHHMRRTEFKRDRLEPPLNLPKRLANCDGAQRDRKHTFRACPLATLRICAVSSLERAGLGAAGGLPLKIAETSQRLVGCGRAVQPGVAGLGNVDVGNPVRARAGCRLLLMLFLTTER